MSGGGLVRQDSRALSKRSATIIDRGLRSLQEIQPGLDNEAYKELRGRIVVTCEQLAGHENDVTHMASLQFYVRLEEAVRVGCLDPPDHEPQGHALSWAFH